MISDFFDRFNNYNCLNDNDNIKFVCHYTRNEDAVKNICKGVFRATRLIDFHTEDKLEGVLILKLIKEILAEEISEEKKSIVDDILGTDDKVNDMIKGHNTYVVSLCLNENSNYMWDKYAYGNGYCICFDKERLINSLFFKVANGTSKQGEYIKHAPIIYDDCKQEEIIKKEWNEMIVLDDADFGLSLKEKIGYIIEHLMYIGNYYKNGSKKRYKSYDLEEEYRLLVNTVERKIDLEDYLPIEKECNNKHYIEIEFDVGSISKVICANADTKSKLDKVVNIPTEVREK